MRRTSLRRLTALSSRTGLSRRAGLLTATRRRPSGFDPVTKARILDRDGHRCVVQRRCAGESDPSKLTVNHIQNRGLGGSTDPGINSVTNGITVCWGCNGWLEDFPLIARRWGWKQPRGVTGPVRYPDGEWHELLPNGQRRTVRGVT